MFFFQLYLGLENTTLSKFFCRRYFFDMRRRPSEFFQIAGARPNNIFSKTSVAMRRSVRMKDSNKKTFSEHKIFQNPDFSDVSTYLFHIRPQYIFFHATSV
jgi:hypothetical protein